jgi:hypothetical protein
VLARAFGRYPSKRWALVVSGRPRSRRTFLQLHDPLGKAKAPPPEGSVSVLQAVSGDGIALGRGLRVLVLGLSRQAHQPRIYSQTVRPMRPPVSIYNQVVLPVLGGSSKHEIRVQATPYSANFVHHRSISRKLRTCVTEVSHAEASAPRAQVERALYGGIYWPNYGHFLAEGIHRLWPFWYGLVSKDCPIAFHLPVAGAKVKPLQPFVVDILAFLGIPAKNVMMIDRPTQFGELIIPQQGKLLGQRASDEYSASFKSMPGGEARFDGVYVSRSRHLMTGSYLGESLLQAQLERAGFTVIHPEEWSLRELVGIYRHASAIIFSEGSPIHVMEVTGGSAADVMIVNRRSARFVETNFVDSIAPLCKRVLAFEHKAPLTPLYWDDRKAQPVASLASAYVDLVSLLSAISGFFATDVGQLDPVALKTALQMDLLKVVFHADIKRLPDATVGRLFRMLKTQVDDLGLTA